ncbi:DUF6965 family protein [Pedobacter sp.]
MELQRLQQYFADKGNMAGPLQIDGFMRVNDPQIFIGTNLARAYKEVDKWLSEPCILRLQQWEKYYETKKQINNENQSC